jgi:hypothetical protein
MPSSFVFAGGVRLGDGVLAWNFSAPFASLIVGEVGIEIRITFLFYRKLYNFPRVSISSIEYCDGFFSKGLRIRSAPNSGAQPIVFWFKDRAALKRKLSELGYPINVSGDFS